MKRVCWSLGFCLVASVLFTGCRGFRFSEPPASKIGERSDDERQRQADRKAMQLGEKPTPVDHTRN